MTSRINRNLASLFRTSHVQGTTWLERRLVAGIRKLFAEFRRRLQEPDYTLPLMQRHVQHTLQWLALTLRQFIRDEMRRFIDWKHAMMLDAIKHVPHRLREELRETEIATALMAPTGASLRGFNQAIFVQSSANFPLNDFVVQ